MRCLSSVWVNLKLDTSPLNMLKVMDNFTVLLVCFEVHCTSLMNHYDIILSYSDAMYIYVYLIVNYLNDSFYPGTWIIGEKNLE